jgi:hypothetical protein
MQEQHQSPKGWRSFHLCFFGFFFLHGAYVAHYFGWPALLDALCASVFVVIYLYEKENTCADS